MTRVHVSNLTGRALDWATGEAVGLDIFTDGAGMIRHGKLAKPWAPSTLWMCGGPLIEEFLFLIEPDIDNESWLALKRKPKILERWIGVGPTPLIALCRAIVASKLGEWVDVPDELVGSNYG